MSSDNENPSTSSTRSWLRGALLVAAVGVLGWHGAAEGAWIDVADEPPELSPRLGGAITTDNHTPLAFSQPAPKLPFEQRGLFELGDSFFNQNWVQAPASTTARDGLGPLFNARACSGCHSRDGRGRPPTADEDMVSGILFRLSVADSGGAQIPEPIYGGQFNHLALPGVAAEGRVRITYDELQGAFADGTPYTLQDPDYVFTDLAYGDMDDRVLMSPRVAPQMIGLGLLQAVPAEDVLAFADPDDSDGDGISGRATSVTDLATGETMLGRFGWKANQPHLRQQVAGAFNGDMGLTTALFHLENHSRTQGATGLDDLPTGADALGEPELPDRVLDAVTFYAAHLAVPAQRDADSPTVQRGYHLFHQARCDTCHVPTLHTGPGAGFPVLSGQTIHPFTDLLLHDMGPELADGRPDGEATGREWRTPPLWGIGLFDMVNGHTRYLHDGRARNLTEAILWHGGEGADSRDRFKALAADDRAALIAFLKSL